MNDHIRRVLVALFNTDAVAIADGVAIVHYEHGVFEYAITVADDVVTFTERNDDAVTFTLPNLWS